ncbi:MAG TPA: hypothetical protein VGW80_09955 [Solirubrobacterales bacterium]|jgi:hypothetical protein|nr:hypothetical protein [Solirubrobacterales bacterium]
MKLTKILGVVAAAAMALMAFASTASATTLEIGGVKQTSAVTIVSSLKAGTSAILKDTSGSFANTCTESTVEGKTSTFTGTTVSGPISSLTFKSCKEEPVVVDTTGSLSVEWIPTTAKETEEGKTSTKGTVRSIGAKVTSPSPFGALTCTTAASPGTDIGTLTGVSSGAATMDINAVLNCGFFLPSAKWEGTYTVTSPAGLGVTS